MSASGEPAPVEESAPPLCGGRYRLFRELGSGGAAVVYLAFDSMLGVWRAVKLLTPRMAGKQKVRERFLNEARTVARLRHPHIVTVYDVGIDGDRVYMVMETLEGGSVSERMKAHGPLPPRMASAVVQALLAGLSEAHKHGVVHRDVKPQNILMSKEGVPKLIDFGIAQNADRSMTKTGAVIGTWAFMAPEQRTNAKAVDPRSDIYATGAVLYALVTGKDPFDLYATDLHAKLFAGLPEPLTRVIIEATGYEQDARFDNAAEMYHALRKAHDELPPDPDTPELTAAGSELPPLPQASDEQFLEGYTGQPSDAARQPPSTQPTLMDSGEPPSLEDGPREMDGVSVSDFDIDGGPYDVDSDDVDLYTPHAERSRTMWQMVALGTLVVAGLVIGIGAAVMMEGEEEQLPPDEKEVESEFGVDTEPEGIEMAPDEGEAHPDEEGTPDVEEAAAGSEDEAEAGDAEGASEQPGPDEPAGTEPDEGEASQEAEADVIAEPEPAPAASGPRTFRVECAGRAGDALRVDGVKVGTLPVDIYLDPGEHGFGIEGSGGAVERVVNIGPSDVVELCR